MTEPRPSLMLPDSAAHLARFLRWLTPAAIGFGVLSAVGGLHFGDAPSIRTAVLLVSVGVVAIVARWMLGRGRTRGALILTGATILGIAPVAAITQPINPAVSIVPLLAVGVMLSLLSGRRLAVFMFVAWLTTLMTSVTLVVVPPETMLPSSYEEIFTVLGTATAVGLYLLLSWQASIAFSASSRRARSPKPAGWIVST